MFSTPSTADMIRTLAATATVPTVAATGEVTTAPLYEGCETTLAVWRDGEQLADVTSTTGFQGPVLVWFEATRKRAAARRGYRFPDLATGIAAAVSYADRGYWHGEL